MAKENPVPYSKRYFQFNLIPPKTEQEITQLVERDNTLFYSFLLIFFGMVFFFFLTLIKVILVDPSLNQVESNINIANQEIAKYDGIRSANGELYIKAQSLDPILDKDVDVIKVLDLEARIRAKFPNLITVTDYGRNGDGSFSMGFLISDAKKLSDIMDYLATQSDVANVFLKDTSWDNGQSGPASISITFFLLNLTAGGDQKS